MFVFEDSAETSAGKTTENYTVEQASKLYCEAAQQTGYLFRFYCGNFLSFKLVAEICKHVDIYVF